MLFDHEATPPRRKWCVFEAWRCVELGLPLRLFCVDGEITRGSTEPVAQALVETIGAIDLRTASCSVKSDGDMIHRAVEDSRGGFAAVHAPSDDDEPITVDLGAALAAVDRDGGVAITLQDGSAVAADAT